MPKQRTESDSTLDARKTDEPADNAAGPVEPPAVARDAGPAPALPGGIVGEETAQAEAVAAVVEEGAGAAEDEAFAAGMEAEEPAAGEGPAV